MNQRTRRPAVRCLIYSLILTTTALFLDAPHARASLAPSGIESGEGVSTRVADMRVVSTALESKALRGRLHSLGLEDKEVEERLSKLSDADVHQLASRIDAVQPGGLIVEILVIVALALVIVYFAKRV